MFPFSARMKRKGSAGGCWRFGVEVGDALKDGDLLILLWDGDEGAG